MTALQSLHDTDFYSWTQQQAALLRMGNLAALDVANLLDEIEDMGRSERRELENRLTVLLMHLLKWYYEPSRRGKSWSLTIKEQRNKIKRLLRHNPGLQAAIHEAINEAYEDARLQASRKTSLDEFTFPPSCPWTFEYIVRDEFWPEAKV